METFLRRYQTAHSELTSISNLLGTAYAEHASLELLRAQVLTGNVRHLCETIDCAFEAAIVEARR